MPEAAPPTKLAFGVEPSHRRYRLRLARYPALAAELAAFADAADPARPLTLLDAGVGRGRTLRYLEPTGRAARFRAVGFDLDPHIAERVNAASRWRLLRADLDRPLPFRDAAFDALVCEQVLEHVDHPVAALREFARCLRAGGLLVVGVPTFPPGVAALRTLTQPFRGHDADHAHTHVQSWSARSAAAAVRAAGAFEIGSVRGFRSASGGVLSPLEDLRAWWRLNAALGRALPWFCAEVQIVARRR